MHIQITAEDIERANRLARNPLESDHMWHTIDPKPVANDDGLFNYRDEYVPCFGCQPDPLTGEATWSHGHIVVEGSNGGVRCEPLTDESLRRFVRDTLYTIPNWMAIEVGQADAMLTISMTGSTAVRLCLSITETASDTLARDDADALDRLIARNCLFEDTDGE